MSKGTVRWFNREKGYGFIQPDEGEHQIFVHIAEVKSAGLESLKGGARLEFEATERKDGIHRGKNVATNLRLL